VYFSISLTRFFETMYCFVSRSHLVSCGVYIICLTFARLSECDAKTASPDAGESWKYFLRINFPRGETKNSRRMPNSLTAGRGGNVTSRVESTTSAETRENEINSNTDRPIFADHSRNTLDINDFVQQNFPRATMMRVSRYFRKQKPCRTISFRRRLLVPGCLPVALRVTACIGTSASLNVPRYTAGVVVDTEFCSKCTPVAFRKARTRIFCKPKKGGASYRAERLSYASISKCSHRPCT